MFSDNKILHLAGESAPDAENMCDADLGEIIRALSCSDGAQQHPRYDLEKKKKKIDITFFR